MLKRPVTYGWVGGFLIAFLIVQVMLFAMGYLFIKGVGIWGVNIPIGWGFAIVNFVWWIGIGHAGTLISAILALLRQSWRNSINRFAEAMTLFAVACAGLFPVLHTGRPWLAYWLFPYPNTMNYWPQFRSPLVWDVFAVSTYATTSLLFWFIGLIPDLATLRDRSTNKFVKITFGLLAMGWRGSARHWARYETAYLLLAGLATPLVLSVHTVVSFDFAIGIVPGWHTTIFPPYFVAGAIYSGFAMVLVLAIPIRKFYDVGDFITERHLENSAMVMLATGLDRSLRICLRSIHELVRRQSIRGVPALEPPARALCSLVFGSALLQYCFAADLVDQKIPYQSDLAVPYFARCFGRHVAGAVHYRCGQSASRLPHIVVGNVLPHAMGLGDLHRHSRDVQRCHVLVRSPAAR